MFTDILPPDLVAECEAIAPPCVTFTGETGAHGAYVQNLAGTMRCTFCGAPALEPAHHDPEALAGALVFAEPWMVAT